MTRISDRNLQAFAGRRLYLQFEPEAPTHERGFRSDQLLKTHFGLGFDSYIEQGGSVMRLARLERQGALEAA